MTVTELLGLPPHLERVYGPHLCGVFRRGDRYVVVCEVCGTVRVHSVVGAGWEAYLWALGDAARHRSAPPCGCEAPLIEEAWREVGRCARCFRVLPPCCLR